MTLLQESLAPGAAQNLPEATRTQLAALSVSTEQYAAFERRLKVAPEKLPGGDPVTAARQLLALCMSGTHQRMLLGLVDRATDERIEVDAELAIRTFLCATA